MIVIGIVGRMGSGKDTALDYLAERCDLPVVVVGDIARDIADERGVEPTRENLQAISQEFMSRYGDDYFMRQVVDRIREHEWSAVGVSGIRSPVDVGVLREEFGEDLLLIAVLVGDPRLRFERLQRRADPRDPDTWQEFVESDRDAETMFDLSEALDAADMTIRNDRTLDALYEQLEHRVIEDRLSSVTECESE